MNNNKIAMPAPTDNLEQAKRDMDATGVAIMRGLFTPEQISELRERMAEQAELEREQGVAFFANPELGDHPTKGALYHQKGTRIGRPKKDPAFQSVRFLVNKGRVFIDLALNPTFLEMAKHCLRETFYIGTAAGIIVRKGAEAQVIHRDQATLRFETDTPVMLNLMVALSDYTADMGATLVVPGTHLDPAPQYVFDNGKVEVEGLDESRLVPAEMKLGDVFFFESRVWHGQGKPIVDEARWSISLIYAVHWWRAQDLFVAAMLDDVHASLTVEERKMFGFDVYSHGAGAIGPTNPTSRRYNSNIELPYIPELRRGSSAVAVPAGEVEDW